MSAHALMFCFPFQIRGTAKRKRKSTTERRPKRYGRGTCCQTKGELVLCSAVTILCSQLFGDIMSRHTSSSPTVNSLSRQEYQLDKKKKHLNAPFITRIRYYGWSGVCGGGGGGGRSLVYLGEEAGGAVHSPLIFGNLSNHDGERQREPAHQVK